MQTDRHEVVFLEFPGENVENKFISNILIHWIYTSTTMYFLDQYYPKINIVKLRNKTKVNGVFDFSQQRINYIKITDEIYHF